MTYEEAKNILAKRMDRVLRRKRMTNIEHYFENLLFDGKDVNGDCTKKELTAAEQIAVKICADYVIYTLFHSREEFLAFIEEKRKRLTQNKWEIYEEYAKKLEEILAED